MRVGLLSQWYPPEGARIAEAWAVELQRLGHEVHVVTAFPNYPSGRVYDGYRIKLYQKDVIKGVVVHRGPIYPSHDANPIKRFLNYISYSVGSIMTSFRVPKVDVWLTNCTPVTAASAAVVQKALKGTPTVTVVQDLWPDSVLESGFLPPWLDKIVRPPVNGYCNLVYRYSDVVGVISPGMAALLEERGVPSGKLRYLPNGARDFDSTNSNKERGILRSELGLPEGRLFMYAGNIGPLQNLCSLIEVFERSPGAQLVIIGGGVSETEVRERASGVPNVLVLDRVRGDVIGDYVSASDIQIISLVDSPLLRVTMPSKVQTAIAAGKPVMVHATGDVAEVIEGAGAGLSASPSDLEASTAVVARFVAMEREGLAEMGARARELFEDQYSLRVTMRTLETVLRQVTVS